MKESVCVTKSLLPGGDNFFLTGSIDNALYILFTGKVRTVLPRVFLQQLAFVLLDITALEEPVVLIQLMVSLAIFVPLGDTVVSS